MNSVLAGLFSLASIRSRLAAAVCAAAVAAGASAQPARPTPAPALTSAPSPVIVLEPPASAPALAVRRDAVPGAVAPVALPDGIERQVRQLAENGTRSLLATTADAAPGRASRVEVQVGGLDPRLRLAPCQRIEAYAGPGTRWWGATRVGLRCTDGAARWNVFVPVTVVVHGRALVATAALPAGTVLAAGDLALAEVDLAADASAALADPALASGRTLLRALPAGQSLRQSHLKPRQWFAAGDNVRVMANGDGFMISGEAVALTRGTEGEAARVRTEGGRVLTGMPTAERRIDLPL